MSKTTPGCLKVFAIFMAFFVLLFIILLVWINWQFVKIFFHF